MTALGKPLLNPPLHGIPMPLEGEWPMTSPAMSGCTPCMPMGIVHVSGTRSYGTFNALEEASPPTSLAQRLFNDGACIPPCRPALGEQWRSQVHARVQLGVLGSVPATGPPKRPTGHKSVGAVHQHGSTSSTVHADVDAAHRGDLLRAAVLTSSTNQVHKNMMACMKMLAGPCPVLLSRRMSSLVWKDMYGWVLQLIAPMGDAHI